MAATRKPGKCDACGQPLRVYVSIGDKQEIIEDAAVCRKCRTVYKRPTCFDRCTLELSTDSKMVMTVLKKIDATVAPVKETESLEK